MALDGCVLKCVSACLARAGVTADVHLVLSDYGVKKRTHADFDAEQAAEVYVRNVLPIALGLNAKAKGDRGDDRAARADGPSADNGAG